MISLMFVCLISINNLILKKVKLLHFGHMVLGVWNPKDCLEKREVVLRLRQNIWKKYNNMFMNYKMVRRKNLWI